MIILKRSVQLFVAAILLGSITIQAEPNKLWDWTPSTTYVNGNVISASDVQTFTLHCNTTPDEQGEPYEIAIALDDPGAPPSVEDMAPVVQGRFGTFYCAATQKSTAFQTESGFSNEVAFTVAPKDLGFVPLPPVLQPPTSQ